MRALPAVLLLAALVPSSGCYLYFGDDGGDYADDGWDDGPCVGGGPTDPGTGAEAAPAIELRNPYTAECYSGGGGTCGDQNGGPAPGGSGADIWFDNRWGQCVNYCNALDEGTCLAADGCRAIYADCPLNAECATQTFSACWATSQDGPIRGGDCAVISDAFECSQHDDCSALHRRAACDPTTGVMCDAGALAEFAACLNEGDVMPPPPPPPPPPASCVNLDEATCIDMDDGCVTSADGQQSCGTITCEPIYAGSGCDCTPMGCTCSTWTFESCQAS